MDIPQHLCPVKHMLKNYNVIEHLYDVPPAVTPEMALDPNFWQHQSAHFNVGDHVMVRAENKSFFLLAEVIAIDPLKHWAQLRKLLLAVDDGTSIGAPDNDGYVIHHDPVQQYRILRGRDLVEHGFATEAEARARLAEIKIDGEAPAGMKRKVA